MIASAAGRLASVLRRPDRPALVTFMPAGFPSVPASLEVLTGLAAAGADVLEIGVPSLFAPYDGPDITAANNVAVAQGVDLAETLHLVRRAARTTATPIVVMSYWADAFRYGIDRFAAGLAAAGAAGAMIPDLPAMHAGTWSAAARRAGVDAPMFVHRRDGRARLHETCVLASGWLYAPAVDAPTGWAGELDIPPLRRLTRRLQRLCTTPVVTGVGISTPDHARAVAPYVAGIVIGSALVRPLLRHPSPVGLGEATGVVRAFSEALRNSDRATHRIPSEIRGGN